MDIIEECRRKTENQLRFLALDPDSQLAYLEGLPFREEVTTEVHPHVDRLQWLMDNFVHSHPELKSPTGERSGIEAAMLSLLELQFQKEDISELWCEEGIRTHPMWRVLRLLARSALNHAGVESIRPTVGVNELAYN